MFYLSQVTKSLPVGVTYASFAEICIIATSIVRVIKFNQVQSTATTIGLFLIIAGVVIVNLLCQNIRLKIRTKPWRPHHETALRDVGAIIRIKKLCTLLLFYKISRISLTIKLERNC